MRRLTFWKKRDLFRKKEIREGKEIFSSFPEASPLKIYDRDYWWSDAWDPTQYAQEIDFSRSFLEQVHELYKTIPYPSRSVRNLVRSDYCDQANDFKDCYLCFNGDHGEECLYGVTFYTMRNSVDFFATNSCELCYELFSVGNSYKTAFAFESSGCRDSWFLSDCGNLSNCVGCVNLSNKQFHILNQPYSKEEYQDKLTELDFGSYRKLTEFKQKFADFQKNFPVKYTHAFRTVNTVGEYVYDARNAYQCYEAVALENVAYVQSVATNVKDSYDYTNWGDNVELMYESVVCGDKCKGLKFCIDCWPACQDLEYCINCHSSANLFGCVGLTKKEYCILNKQYSKEEYEALVPKLKEFMARMPYSDRRGVKYAYGEFFPAEFSPLAYNESAAPDYYPIDQKRIAELGFAWRETEQRGFEATIEAKDLPDHIKDVKDDILQQIIKCGGCGRAYRVISSELEFYRRMGLPLPRLCYRCRYEERTKNRNRLKWYHRKCMCGGIKSENGVYTNLTAHNHGADHCPIEMESAYAPERTEMIYCESCYQIEVA